MANDDGDRMVRVAVHTDATRRAAAAAVMSEVIGGSPGEPAYEAGLTVLTAAMRDSWFAQHADDPTEEDGCFCEEAGWWCDQIDGPRSPFWYVYFPDIDMAERAGDRRGRA
jgi:hypothetical protein